MKYNYREYRIIHNRRQGRYMKKIIAKKLVLIVGSTMAVILLLNFLIQREDALEYLKNSSALVIKQIGSILDRNFPQHAAPQ